jgi:hypothetical protein
MQLHWVLLLLVVACSLAATQAQQLDRDPPPPLPSPPPPSGVVPHPPPPPSGVDFRPHPPLVPHEPHKPPTTFAVADAYGQYATMCVKAKHIALVGYIYTKITADFGVQSGKSTRYAALAMHGKKCNKCPFMSTTEEMQQHDNPYPPPLPSQATLAISLQ